jgi:hypothetical protein
MSPGDASGPPTRAGRHADTGPSTRAPSGGIPRTGRRPRSSTTRPGPPSRRETVAPQRSTPEVPPRPPSPTKQTKTARTRPALSINPGHDVKHHPESDMPSPSDLMRFPYQFKRCAQARHVRDGGGRHQLVAGSRALTHLVALELARPGPVTKLSERRARATSASGLRARGVLSHQTQRQ